MTVAVEIPGGERLVLEHLVLDVNGTLTSRGVLIDGVRNRLAAVASDLTVHLLSADTYGTLGAVTEELGVRATMVATGSDKSQYVAALGAEQCVAIGNGANDAAMVETAALGIAVIGPEGAARGVLAVADIVCVTIGDALDLVVDPRALRATLRA